MERESLIENGTGSPLRILMLTPMEPYPPVGGARSVYHTDLEMLRQLGHQTHVLSLTTDPDADPARLAPLATAEYFYSPKPNRALQVLRNLGRRIPYTIQRMRHSALVDRAVELVRGGDVDVVMLQEIAVAELGRMVRARASVPVYYRGHALITSVTRRFYQAARNPALRLFAWRQYEKNRRFEASLGGDFDLSSQISEVDAAAFRDATGLDHVPALFPTVRRETLPVGSFEARKPHTVVSCGTLEPITTLPAMLWLADEVWPRVRAKHPQAKLELYGRATPSRLNQLRDQGVRVNGPVADMLPHLHEGAVFVSPMLTGSGVRISVLNAMATGNAIVATRVSAEGIPYREGEDLFVSDDPAQFAEAVCRLLDDASLRRRVGQAARAVVENERFAWDANAARLDSHLRETIRRFAGNEPPRVR